MVLFVFLKKISVRAQIFSVRAGCLGWTDRMSSKNFQLSGRLAIANSCFWLADLKNSFPMKPPCQMDPNYTGNIYEKAHTKFPHFVPIGIQIWQPWAILVFDCSWFSRFFFLSESGWFSKFIFLSETTRQNRAKHDRK